MADHRDRVMFSFKSAGSTEDAGRKRHAYADDALLCGACGTNSKLPSTTISLAE